MKFESANRYGTGRPRGSKNRLHRDFIEATAAASAASRSGAAHPPAPCNVSGAIPCSGIHLVRSSSVFVSRLDAPSFFAIRVHRRHRH
jgi:hypothetical protein